MNVSPKPYLYIKDYNNYNKNLLAKFIRELVKLLHLHEIPEVDIDTDSISIYVKELVDESVYKVKWPFYIRYSYRSLAHDTLDMVGQLLKSYHYLWPNRSYMYISFTAHIDQHKFT